MRKVVHITAHLGGGAGKILSSISINSKSSNEIEHIIITLEQTQTTHFEEVCKKNNVQVLCAKECNIEEILNEADIIQLNWWNHPLTSEFTYKYLGNIKCRLIVWSHISGCSYPFISKKFVSFPDAFVFSTPYSYDNKIWSEEERKIIIENSYLVVSSGLELDKAIDKKIHDGFNVGYIGFLGYNKTHPNFIKYCEAALNIPNVKFIVVGDTLYGEELINDARKSKALIDKVIFKGYSLKVYENLAEFDVFGYLLNPNHTGTAENALLEAMASGVVPVVLNNSCEKYIVQNMETGLIVNNVQEYANALKWLYENPSERNRLATNASKYIIEEYGIQSTIRKINNIYNEILKREKTLHDATDVIGQTPYEWFLSCYVGNVNKIEGNAFGKTKGSVKQYLKYFNKDKKLREVVKKNESRV